MNSSRNQSRRPCDHASLADQSQLFTCVSPKSTSSGNSGSFNDGFALRGIITDSIRNCGKSREVIAEEMTQLLGSVVTSRALDSYTAESAQQNRFPAEYMRAFCHVTGNSALILHLIACSGLHAISDAEHKLLELGRAYLRRKRAEKNISAIEQEFEGVDL